MLHSISSWIKDSFGSYLGFLIVVLLLIIPFALFFSARIAYIFNIGNMRSRKEWDSSSDLGSGGAFLGDLGGGSDGGGFFSDLGSGSGGVGGDGGGGGGDGGGGG